MREIQHSSGSMAPILERGRQRAGRPRFAVRLSMRNRVTDEDGIPLDPMPWSMWTVIRLGELMIVLGVTGLSYVGWETVTTVVDLVS